MIVVIITLLNDKRFERTIKSLLEQTIVPEKIIIADGGSTDGSFKLAKEYEKKYDNIKVLSLPGSITETRNKVLKKIKSDVIVFIDADEVAPKHWLKSLIGPIINGEADFTGGPTKPLSEAKSNVEKYVNDFDDWFYKNIVSNDITMLPMGNSAWSKKVFDAIGGFDEKLRWDSEDYDMNLRAVKAGFKGVLVPEAWAYHDQSHLNTKRKIIKRKYKYSVGATIAYLKNNILWKKATKATEASIIFRHPYEWINLMIKPVALIHGIIVWKLRQKK